jgi:hypothetical protein
MVVDVRLTPWQPEGRRRYLCKEWLGIAVAFSLVWVALGSGRIWTATGFLVCQLFFGQLFDRRVRDYRSAERERRLKKLGGEDDAQSG